MEASVLKIGKLCTPGGRKLNLLQVQLNEKVSAALNEKEFSEEMGMAGEQLLRDKLEGDCKGAERVETLLMSMVIARE